MEEEVSTLLRVVTLPEECECGSNEGTVAATDIERTTDSVLLMEVGCKKCGATQFLPDELAEGRRGILGENYCPTWFLTKTNELIHWASPEGRTLRLEAIIGSPISTK